MSSRITEKDRPRYNRVAGRYTPADLLSEALWASALLLALVAAAAVPVLLLAYVLRFVTPLEGASGAILAVFVMICWTLVRARERR